MGAAADCELIGPGFLSQPLNSITTLAFVAAGVMVARRPSLRWIGAGLVATGVGSFLFHGPMPTGSQWAHDVTLAWLVLLVAGLGRSWEPYTRLPGLAVLGVFLAVVPQAADPIAVALTVVAVVLILTDDQSMATVGPMALLGTTAIIGRLGATDWPLCDPESLLQTHALWHVGAAVAVAWWALGRPAEAPDSSEDENLL